MPETTRQFAAFAEGRAPFRSLAPEHFKLLTDNATPQSAAAGDTILELNDPVAGLYVITSGAMDLISPQGDVLAKMHAGDVFGHRATLRETGAIYSVKVTEDATYTIIAAHAFSKLIEADRTFASFFSRRAGTPGQAAQAASDLTGLAVGDVMTKEPVTLLEDQPVIDAARLMADKHISCVLVTKQDGTMSGIITSGDLVRKVIADHGAVDDPLTAVMTSNPISADPEDTMLTAIIAMTDKRIAHLPVTDKQGLPIGIITQTDLVRRNSNSMVYMVQDIARQTDYEGLAAIVARKPQMLAELVGSGVEGHQIGRLMTGVGDAVTKHLIALAEEKLGPAPISWLWLACGSQGREEQTGVSDQDNCLFLSDDYSDAEHSAYFEAFAKFVSDGLDACGYYYCPGDMMATNPKWRQPVSVWKNYFDTWIEKPDPMAQMLASVMFDLRPIAGDKSLFGDLNRRTLEKASKDSIFRAHMISNSLKHTPPLGLFGGLTYVRDGDHKNAIDMKHSGVVPITDLARAYALQGRIEAVNTRDRLVMARDMDGVLSKTGGGDLIDAYDLIVELRLAHQTNQIRAGVKPDNFMVPDTLSALERNHLKDAFSVVKTLQSAAGYGRP